MGNPGNLSVNELAQGCSNPVDYIELGSACWYEILFDKIKASRATIDGRMPASFGVGRDLAPRHGQKVGYSDPGNISAWQ